MLGQEEFDLYKDIQSRTKGELYLGIVGPVRTGKSTFVRRFMNQVVIPNMEKQHRELATDELPVSGKGTLITTVEPKFVPKEAVQMSIDDHLDIKVRLIDCVGYIVDGAGGVYDQDKERMVKTPWFSEEIPFSQAAHIGTDKVIKEHATIGIVVTADGSFGEIGREQFIPAEEQTVAELKSIGKPFIIVLNSGVPYADQTQSLAREIEQKYAVTCVPVNCDQLHQRDIYAMLKAVLMEFPINTIQFFLPKWLEMLPEDDEIRQSLIEMAKAFLEHIRCVKDIHQHKKLLNSRFLEKYYIDDIDTATGTAAIHLDLRKANYYQMLSKLLGKDIRGESDFYHELSDLVEQKHKIQLLSSAIGEVRQKGYSSVMPPKDEVVIKEPVIIKHGNKYGVNIKATAPSIHMISAEIETEIAPLVGTQQQAQDLADYIKNAGDSEDKNSIWNTLIFGKTMEELVDEGMKTKIAKMTDSCQEKLQETLQKIINDSNGSVIFVII